MSLRAVEKVVKAVDDFLIPYGGSSFSMSITRPDLNCSLDQGGGVNDFARSLNDSWKELCARFLPVASKDSEWLYSRESMADDPGQGWKLHISANVLRACEVMQRIAPCLQARGALFKAPCSLDELMRINCGMYYGYSQVGKFITVYPRNDREAVSLARWLHKATFAISAPVVPFDLRFREKSCVYYRYGAFKLLEMEQPDSTRVPAIRKPDGALVPDLRKDGAAKPDWVTDPFTGERARQRKKTVDSPLKQTFRVFRALAQRGKGGVYQALDLSTSPPRLCILKEGRAGGEIGWDGRDGHWCIRNEERVLSCLQAAGINVPHVYSSFEVEGHYYLAMEYIDGVSLHASLCKKRRRMAITQVMRLAVQVCLLVEKIHAAGWVWRDCKPTNLIVTNGGELRPLDFEGACRVDEPDPLAWSTPEFAPPRWAALPPGQSKAPEDMYVIGAFIYFLFAGRVLEATDPAPLSKMRRNVPSSVCSIVAELVDADPRRRPTARAAARRFKDALASLKAKSAGSRTERDRQISPLSEFHQAVDLSL